ncbi:MAG: FliA/WhiG family RNA polymerase sigma factor [Deltaproteobacteria bacterium]|nr:MAG: FliA/WhiG family RNA polymerase sigma factor [Deltaproteobacteria bacterium]
MNAAVKAYGNFRPADRQDREKVVRTYLPLVKKIAYRMARTIPSSVDIKELVSAGCMGLLVALERFDPSRGLDFETFAEFRIKGAILDELRSMDTMSRRNRRLYRRIERCRSKLRNELGREPEPDEMARELGIEREEYLKLESNLSPAVEMSLAIMEMSGTGIASDGESRPDRKLQKKQLRQALKEAVVTLPERLRTVLSLYYYLRLNYREIAQLMGITESRVCQLHQKAVRLVRQRLVVFEGGGHGH